MNDNDKEKYKIFSIYQRPGYFTIKNTKTKEYLDVSLPDFKLKYTYENANYGEKVYQCYGIMGAITLKDTMYLILIADAEMKKEFFDKPIFKATYIDFLILYKKPPETEIPITNDLESANNQDTFNANYTLNVDKILINLKKLFKEGIYFSNSYDLTNSITSQKQIEQEFNEKYDRKKYSPIYEANKNFLANWKFIEKFLVKKPNDTDINNTDRLHDFISSCIYGNIESCSFKINEKEKIDFILISRRYIFNYAYDGYRKGIRKYGLNTNQIETELIFIYNDTHIFSYISLSASLPVYVNKETKDINKDNKAFNKYFNSLAEEYSQILAINIENTKIEHKVFNKKFKTFYTKSRGSLKNTVKYFSFLLNDKEKNKGAYDNFECFLNDKSRMHDELISKIGFLHKKKVDKKFVFDNSHKQVAIFALFGLDFKIINESEAVLFFYVFKEIVNKCLNSTELKNFCKNNYYNEENDKTGYTKGNQLLYEKNKNQSAFSLIDTFKTLFSYRYCELKNQYIKSDKFCSQEEAKFFQRILEIAFNRNIRKMPVYHYLEKLREQYSMSKKLMLYVANWNVSAMRLDKDYEVNLDKMLIPKKDGLKPNVYLIGLEEVVELNATNVMFNSEDDYAVVVKQWSNKIEDTLKKVGKYKKIIDMILVGILLFCYVAEDDLPNINSLSQKYIKTGWGGSTGNKGSCLIYFNYYNSRIAVACSHLAAGLSSNPKRMKEINEILHTKLDDFKKIENENDGNLNVNNKEDSNHSDIVVKKDINGDNINSIDNLNIDKLIFDARLSAYSQSLSQSIPSSQSQYRNSSQNILITSPQSPLFKNSDIWILFGDLNFRIDLNYDEFQGFVEGEQKDWSKLFEFDQFNKSRNASLDLSALIAESPVRFQPSYKFLMGCDNYDYRVEEEGSINDKKKPDAKDEQAPKYYNKKRNPSWCDRILYKNNCENIKGLEYDIIFDESFRHSDHRPIFELFELTVFKEDEQRKKVIENEIIGNKDMEISSNYLKPVYAINTLK